jgi:PPM family protein phosphatase
MPASYCHAIHAFAYSDVGKVRRTNEDSFVIADLTRGIGIEENGILKFESGRQGALFAVADGMGGAAAGEMASRIGVKSVYEEVLQLSEEIREVDTELLDQILIDAVGIANRRIFDISHSKQDFKGMGTTLTAVLELQGQLAIGQIGDSRAYLIRNQSIRQLTRDQSLVAQKVSNGELTEAQARQHPERNILLQALGMGPTVQLGIVNATARAEDMILLCSDGLHAQMSADEINEIVLYSANEQDACLELVNLANDRGGPDNITAVLVRFF